MVDEKELRAELEEIDAELAKEYKKEATLGRVAEIMSVGGAAQDNSRASFVLGQVFEALRPERERRQLETKRERILKSLRQLAQPQSS